MKKSAQVIMLPTKEPSLGCISNQVTIGRYYDIVDKAHLIVNPISNPTFKYYHLYIVSDEKIKEGDWFILNKKEVWKHNGEKDPVKLYGKQNCKKIIATTDTSLKYPYNRDNGDFIDLIILPQPSQAFIEKYIKEYNKGNIITDVLVEYEVYGAYCKGCNQVGLRHCAHADTCGAPVDLIRPKVSKDNTITIHPIKDSWNREEVIELFDKYINDLNKDTFKEHKKVYLNKWIEENL